jgi:hypothetical protein
MQTKQIVDQALKALNPTGGRTGAFAERRAAKGADLMRHKTLLAERSQSVFAGRVPVSTPTAVAKARNACCQAPVSAKIGRFVFCQTGRAILQPGNLPPGCAGLDFNTTVRFSGSSSFWRKACSSLQANSQIGLERQPHNNLTLQIFHLME